MLVTNSNEEYKILRKIGEGAFSEVYKVKKSSTGEYFAAKQLTRPFLTEKEVEEYSELKLLKEASFHRNVSSLVDYTYEPELSRLTLIFYIMDYSLYDFIKDKKKPLTESRCKNYLFQLTNGLQYLHKLKIFHRDIKPENCLLTIDARFAKTNPLKAETVQIADLGSAKFSNYEFPYSEYISTRWYRSPECILSKGYYGPKMDIWALGCVFYEMLTLHPLFPGTSELDQLDKIHRILGSPHKYVMQRFRNFDTSLLKLPNYTPVGLYKLVPNLSSYGVDILKRTLSYHPDNRISAIKLLEHVYFDDIRNKKFGNDARSSSLSTQSDITSSKSRSSGSAISKVSCNSKVQALHDISNHRMERNWNNPKGSFNRKMLKISKSSIVGSD